MEKEEDVKYESGDIIIFPDGGSLYYIIDLVKDTYRVCLLMYPKSYSINLGSRYVEGYSELLTDVFRA